MSPLIFNEKVQTERIFILLHIKIKGFAVLKERFKWKSFSITIKCFLLLIVAVWSFMNTKNCITVRVQLDLYFSSCLCSSSALPLFHPSVCAHSSRSRYGQRQRQRRHRSPGGDHRKRGGACGGAWWQAAKVPWWVTAIFFFFCFMEKLFWIPEPHFYHSDLFSDIWKISFSYWETECWNRAVTTGLVNMIICRIVITKPWSFHCHKQGFSAFNPSKQHVCVLSFF